MSYGNDRPSELGILYLSAPPPCVRDRCHTLPHTGMKARSQLTEYSKGKGENAPPSRILSLEAMQLKCHHALLHRHGRAHPELLLPPENNSFFLRYVTAS